MRTLLKPDIYQENIHQINYKKLKKDGIKCLAFDLDNTITEPHSYEIDKKTKDLIKKLQKDFTVVMISNSLPHRVKKISKILDIPHYYFAAKPMKRRYKEIIKDYNFKPEEILGIGDQLFTDVLGAKRNNFKVALVKPICNKEFFLTRFNRQLEKLVFKKLKKKYNIKEGEYFE